MKPKFRKSLAWLHTWSGLTLGLVIVLLSVTGAGLVLRPALDTMIYGHLLTVPACDAPLGLDEIAAQARSAHPSSAPYAIELTGEDTASVAVRFADYDYVYVNPCSDAVLGIQNHYAGFFGTLDWLHRFKFIGNGDGSGRPIAGWINLLFAALLIVGGLVLWWPRSRSALRAAVTFNWRLPGTARTLSLHKFLGLYSALLLIVITITALPLGFQSVRDLIGWATHSTVSSRPAPIAAVPAGGAQPLSMQALWVRTRSRFPHFAWVSLYYPKHGSAVFDAEVLDVGMPHANAKSHLYLNAYSGETIRFDGYAQDTSPGRKIYLYMLALHSGLVGGLPYQLLLFLAVMAVPVQAYSGASVYLRRKLRRPAVSTLTLRLVAKTVEAEGICSFEFADPAGRALPPFSAGSHIDVRLGPGLTRQYSLCNDPKDTHRYMIAVALADDLRGGSRAMHERLSVGDSVEIGLPRNHFPLAHGAEHSLLLAAGIGITPILCMAERLSNAGAEFALHYSVRSQANAAFSERLWKSPFADRVQFHVSDEGTRLDIAALLAAQPRDTHLYVCGPTGFMDAVLSAAQAAGWSDAHLHREYFSATAHDTAADTAFNVRIASTGEVIHVAKDETAAAALVKHGIDIPVSCSEGVCGTCLTRVIDGDVDHHDMFLTAEQRAMNDRFTPCCSRARGALLVLDL